MIDTLLSRGRVELNPGPNRNNSAPNGKYNLKILTYNCNGLGNSDKMRRVFTKCRPEVNTTTGNPYH